MKMKASILLNAVLTTILATSLFFMASGLQITSTPKASAAGYDPWLDYDENGIVNMLDLYNTAMAYGTTGDPTKNVTIAGHANKLAYSMSADIPTGVEFITPWIPLDGYSKVSICFKSDSIDNLFFIQARHSGASRTFNMFTQYNVYDFVETYDAPNQEIRVYFVNYDEAVEVNCDIYLIP
jgi:hypothetical protein